MSLDILDQLYHLGPRLRQHIQAGAWSRAGLMDDLATRKQKRERLAPHIPLSQGLALHQHFP